MLSSNTITRIVDLDIAEPILCARWNGRVLVTDQSEIPKDLHGWATLNILKFWVSTLVLQIALEERKLPGFSVVECLTDSTSVAINPCSFTF